MRLEPSRGNLFSQACAVADRVTSDPEFMLFQIGESLQVLSGGEFQATTHWVQSPKQKNATDNVFRLSFAMFFQPSIDEMLTPPPSSSVSVEGWREGITFGEFAKKKFSHYQQHPM